jgi:hypothetical protein
MIETSGVAILDKEIPEYINRYPELALGLAEPILLHTIYYAYFLCEITISAPLSYLIG